MTRSKMLVDVILINNFLLKMELIVTASVKTGRIVRNNKFKLCLNFLGVLCYTDPRFIYYYDRVEQWVEGESILPSNGNWIKYYRNSHFDCHRCADGFYSLKTDQIWGTGAAIDTETSSGFASSSDIPSCVSPSEIYGKFFHRTYIGTGFKLAFGIDKSTDHP